LDATAATKIRDCHPYIDEDLEKGLIAKRIKPVPHSCIGYTEEDESIEEAKMLPERWW
ncbi:hypothetical protein A2U01_0072946, partial [Trifolium medium]|nr:hypothetical protein [Trifolium medium]